MTSLRRRVAFFSVFAALALAPACASDDGNNRPGVGGDNATRTASSDGDRGGRVDSPDDPEGAASTDDAVFGRIPDVVRDVEPCVVAILRDRGEGSGVVWDSAGHVVTNFHVVDGASRIEVAFADGRRAPARVVAADTLTDIAVLDAERDGLPPADFARHLPAVGELAIAIGNPLGFENTVTAGIVSGLHRAIPGSASTTQALVDLIQTDAPISPGNSGGALVDVDAQVIGINVAYIPPAARAVSIGFAIPAPTVRDVVTQLLADGSVEHAFFGIRPAPLTSQIARRLDVEVNRGVVVLDVVPDGPADQAGIQAGDVITAVDGDRVETVESFVAALRHHAPGDEVTVDLVRRGRGLDVTVTFEDRPGATDG